MDTRQASRSLHDIVTEASATLNYLQWELSDLQAQRGGDDRRSMVDDNRLDAKERARLAARSVAFASSTVNERFNKLESIGARAMIGVPQGNPAMHVQRVNMDASQAYEDLVNTVRFELASDRRGRLRARLRPE